LKYISGFTLSHQPDEDDCKEICKMFSDFLKK
jgi:hypothetical protein